MMTREGFQQQAEADGKWKRVTVSQVQLCSYYTGFNEIYELRDMLKKKEAAKFNLKAFHEKFLSYGSQFSTKQTHFGALRPNQYALVFKNHSGLRI